MGVPLSSWWGLRSTVVNSRGRLGRHTGEAGGTFVGRECVVYCGEQLLDMYEPEVSRTSTAVALWHGRGANEREALEPLARQIAGAGVRVMVPDWSTDDGADGRNHLTASLSFDLHSGSKEGPGDRVVLAGWSLGASAGLDLLCHPEAFGGWRPHALVCISGASIDRRSPRGNRAIRRSTLQYPSF